MIKKYLILTLTILLCGISQLHSEQVNEVMARKAATVFVNRSMMDLNKYNLTLAYTASSKANITKTSPNTINYYYIFNVGNRGFVIVAADDIISPILAYSIERPFPIGNIPYNVTKWLEGYKSQIRYAITHLNQTKEIQSEWDDLLIESKVNEQIGTLGIKNVNPLIKTKWDQSPYYNDLCPGESVTGCVATAMAQLMKYWNYPKAGNGFYSYNHNVYGRLSANFGSTTYNWANMPNQVKSSNIEVARLMYHCGVSVDMDYGVKSSGAAGSIVVAPSLIKYFGYSPSISIQERSDYSSLQWINLLKQELNSGRPMYYEGVGGRSGHAFICDGYDVNNFFHFNWGWGGIADGYFKVNELNPQSVGTGSGEGTYNSQQSIVSGIQPPSDVQNYNIGLYADIEINSNPLEYGYPFTVKTNIANNGTNLFEGDYCAALFDSQDNFVDYINTISDQSLAGGYTYNEKLEFSSQGLFELLPGNYTLNIFYRTKGGDWKLVADADGYKNYLELKVTNKNNIELNSPIVLSPSKTLIQGRSTNVNFNVSNEGSTTFRGIYKVNLYNLDGTFAEGINEYVESDGLPSGYTYQAPYITLNTSEIKSSPGTYLLAVQHKYNQKADWELTGSSENQNPIKVNVIADPIQLDKYEPNNASITSSNLIVSFTNNKSSIKTSGANCHNSTDYDYYKINLPEGYNYSITPRLQDLYNSNDGNTYTLDAVFTYSQDGKNWSDTYDDILDSKLNSSGGTTIYFLVSPFFAGKTGNYALDLEIERTTVSNVSEVINNSSTSPEIHIANDKLSIGNGENQIGLVKILNLQGQILTSSEIANGEKNIVLDLNNLTHGVYFIQLFTANGVILHKYNRIQ